MQLPLELSGTYPVLLSRRVVHPSHSHLHFCGRFQVRVLVLESVSALRCSVLRMMVPETGSIRSKEKLPDPVAEDPNREEWEETPAFLFIVLLLDAARSRQRTTGTSRWAEALSGGNRAAVLLPVDAPSVG